MVFSSPVFLFLFLPFTLLGYYLLNPKFRNIFLLIVSLLFYAWGEPKFVFIMMGSILVNYIFALLINRNGGQNGEPTAKLYLALDVVFNLTVFFIFKYLNFTTANINRLAALFRSDDALVRQTSIALPIGISFFTFQAMSYVFDVYYHKGELQRNPLNVMLYVSLFPQLIAGPIVRYQTVADEIHSRKETAEDFARGVERFLIGLAKKAILANTIAVAADSAFSALNNGTLTTGYAWLGALSYSFQIYFDFSGYSDMAIGLGLMFGFHFLENFNYPYLSKTVSEFWRRWHISLGSWFRDYVYIPLGGSRVPKSRLVFNLLVVWALTGLWHGADWTFILWGLMYFVLLTFEKLCGLETRLKSRPVASLLYRLFTLVCIVCGWVLFRAGSISEGASYIAAMFGFAPHGLWSGYTGALFQNYAVIGLICVICCINWKELLKSKTEAMRAHVPGAAFFVKVLGFACMAVITVSFLVSSTYNPFIYFNF